MNSNLSTELAPFPSWQEINFLQDICKILTKRAHLAIFLQVYANIARFLQDKVLLARVNGKFLQEIYFFCKSIASLVLSLKYGSLNNRCLETFFGSNPGSSWNMVVISMSYLQQVVKLTNHHNSSNTCPNSKYYLSHLEMSFSPTTY